ncbi:MAG: hypothetical protein AAGI01_13425 [Myxococcota bacterium]
MTAEVEDVERARAALQSQLERPVVVVAAGWRAEAAVNLDGDAARCLTDVLRAAADNPVLALLGEGGRVAFADHARRMLRAAGVTALLLERARGVFALTALACAHRWFARGAGLGAPDAGPLGRQAGPVDLDVHEALGALGLHAKDAEEHKRHVALGHAWVERAQCRQVLRAIAASQGWDVDRLLRGAGASGLGRALALDHAELTELGATSSALDAEHEEAAWALYEALENTLGLRAKPAPRYTESVLGDEVEFEMASEQIGAVMSCDGCAFVFEQDTGRPHPDTNVFMGDWRHF